ncbi:MAG: M15 family metallopeptidase [Actinomycetota bacterium]|nr:M15 family metallopeptidase [Actinomycetota bacterium]
MGRKQLRRLNIDYVDFAGEVQRGSIVAHRDSIVDLREVFSALFVEAFPISSMRPAEQFGGDLTQMLKANNTSSFNCRRPDQINAPVLKSPHANGRAIDINPLQNPWMDPRCQCWIPSNQYSKANEGPGVIRADSLPWQLFTKRGWIWQNIKVADYMHFDTGYPSKDRESPTP